MVEIPPPTNNMEQSHLPEEPIAMNELLKCLRNLQMHRELRVGSADA